MAYHIAVKFDVPAEHRDEFIAAALEDGRNSNADEPGTLAFNLVEDEETANRFYLIEAYEDEEAFQVHCDGAHFKKFFDIIGSWGQEGPEWLVRGTQHV
ncbi:antibiotic biosynthesis monooxygenase [Nocardiopsis sp. EMB25]|uniref:putative quinol monooxygenase n=1 Tax=Nocardiopsis TaxID=2013 RepID=UPI00034B96BB|nr:MULTISPECIES: putative quinol monooxygenase [Nocardiopsis]MCY9785085.1 antibiotic biosynthesis monooxygenase [Nocardiopsis sp. EMB25]